MDTSNVVISSDLTGVTVSLLFFILVCAGAIYLVYSVAQERADRTERNIQILDAEIHALRGELAALTAHTTNNLYQLSEEIRPLASLRGVGLRAMRGRQAIASADEEIASIERRVVGRVDKMRREEEAMHAYVERQVDDIRGRLVTFR